MRLLVRRFRKMYGGGMRQIGFLAAAGIYALDYHVERLVEDHKKAKRLAQALAGISGIQIEPQRLETNIFYFGVKRKDWTVLRLVEELQKKEVLVLAMQNSLIRIVTHLDVNWEDIENTISVFQKLFS